MKMSSVCQPAIGRNYPNSIWELFFFDKKYLKSYPSISIVCYKTPNSESASLANSNFGITVCDVSFGTSVHFIAVSSVNDSSEWHL
jgi:hypothetical protein